MNDLNKKMIKQSLFADPETGEIISTVYSPVSISERIKLNGKFFKILKELYLI